VSAGLLITLIVLVVIVGGYWVYTFATKESLPVDANAGERTFPIVCSACKARTEITFAEYKAIERDENDNLKCPKCGKFKAAYYRQGGSVLPPGGG